MLLNKKIPFLEICFFIISFIYISYFILSFDNDFYSSNYAFNELFINYEYGFVRRGLIGQLTVFLYENFSVKPKYFLNWLFIFFHSIQLVCFYILIKKKNINFLFSVLIILSPVYLLFPIYDTNVYFVKDVVIKITFLFHALIFIKYKNTSNYLSYLKKVIIPMLIFVIIFIHEYQIIFLSTHILLSYLATKKGNVNYLEHYKIFFLVFVILLFIIGDKELFTQQSDYLKENFNVEIHAQLGGGFKYLLGGFYKWHFFHFNYNDFIELTFAVILTLFLPYIFFQYLINKKVVYYKKKINYLIFFVPTLITFLNLDHGRNLSLLSHHLIVFYLSLDFSKLKEMFFSKLKKNFIFINIFFIFAFFYLFMWILDQDVGFDHMGKRHTIFQGSLLNEFGDLIKFIYFYIDKNLVALPKIYH